MLARGDRAGDVRGPASLVPQPDGAVGRARAWDRAFLLLSRLGQGCKQFVFASGGEAGRAWPVQALFAFPGQ